jgi:hypothetical protein
MYLSEPKVLVCPKAIGAASLNNTFRGATMGQGLLIIEVSRSHSVRQTVLSRTPPDE